MIGKVPCLKNPKYDVFEISKTWYLFSALFLAHATFITDTYMTNVPIHHIPTQTSTNASPLQHFSTEYAGT